MSKKFLFALLFSLILFAACGAPPQTAQEQQGEAGGTQAAAPAQESAEAAVGEEGMVVADTAIVGGEAVVVGDVTFQESPWFEGKGFPPVAERLPLNPKIWDWIPERFGGMEVGRFDPGPLNTIRMDPTWDAVIWTANEEPLVNSPGRLGEEFNPNVVESFDISDDLTVFTFRLREGMRWSDGEPVTTRDVEFAFYDFMLHPILHPVPNTWLRSGGRPDRDLMELEIIDSYTFRLISSEPYGGFITWLAFSNYTNLLQPYHYLKDFHIDYADNDTLMAMVTDQGFTEAEWHTFFQYHRIDGWHSGRTSQMVGGTPTLGPWIQVQNGDLRFYERNPFYWKIDPDGRQLPYIDAVQSQFVTDISAASIRILAGEIDHAYEWVPLNQVALFAEHADAGGYRLLTNTLLHRTDADILINQTHEDPAWRQVAQDVRFRRALSLAINREEMLEAVYFGFARISDIQDPTHNLALANELLDEMGMEFGPDGFRTAPDGSPLFIDFLYSAVMAQYAATAQIANESFRDLGLNINLRQADNAMVDTTVDANEAQLTVAFQHGPVTAMFDDWRFNAWGRLWNLNWETAGAQGEPMPSAVREFYENVFSIRSVHPSEIPSIRARLRQSISENYWSIIPVEDVVQVSLINNDLRNVPDAGFMISACWNADGWWFDR